MKYLDISKFQQMVVGGLKVLDIEYQHINDLNVFPVPDGDTGSNMRTTLSGAVDHMNSSPVNSLHQLGDVLSYGLLMNARGNSGVIFSQIFRGFFSNWTLTTEQLDIPILLKSFELAKEHAYKAVVNPIEGTILTVIRMINEGIQNHEYESIIALFDDVIKYGDEALAKTPDMLQELKTVGVVDSGGYGLMSFLKGMAAVLNDKLDETLTEISKLRKLKSKTAFGDENSNILDLNFKEDGNGFGYCSEVILKLNDQISPTHKENKKHFELEKFKKALLKFGNSLVCVQDKDLVKVHIHTFHPYMLLKLAQEYGEFEKIKIENMTRQYQSKSGVIAKPKVKNGLGMIATVPTKEISDLYKNDYGIDSTIITEGESAPSIQNFVNKIYEVGFKNQLLLVDDSNLVLAANEAAKMVSKDFSVHVLACKNTYNVIVAALACDKGDNLKSNIKNMSKALEKAISATISTSIKNVNYEHIKVKEGNKIGIIDKKIIAADNKTVIVLKAVLDKLMKNKKNIDICYIICGANYSPTILKQFEKYALEHYGLYCEIKEGNQKVYDYYIGLQ